MKTVCLCMIVKDEEHVLRRCLASVKNLISYYVIADTGSTDDTKEVIRDSLHGVRGEILDHPWQDFSTNRNLVLDAARGKADYNLVLDADDTIRGHLPSLTDDVYLMQIDGGDGSIFHRVQLFRSDIDSLRYEGVLHEWLRVDPKLKGGQITTAVYVLHNDGARSKDGIREEGLRDAAVLLAAMKDAPDNDRYAFYYAQSLQMAGDLRSAIAAYRDHLTLSARVGGPPVDRWTSLLRIGILMEEIQEKGSVAQGDEQGDDEILDGEVLDAYLRAFESYPTRLEPMYRLGQYLNDRGRFALTYYLLKPLLDRPVPAVDGATTDLHVYKWALKDLVATAAFYVGDHHLNRRLNEEMLASGSLPADEIPRVTENFELALRSVGLEVNQAAIVPSATLEANAPSVSPFYGEVFTELRRQLRPESPELGVGMMLFALVVSERMRGVVEIGRGRGYATFAMASAMRFLVEESWEEPKEHRQPDLAPGYYRWFEEVGAVRKVYSFDPSPMPEAAELLEKHALRKYTKCFDKRPHQVELGDFLQRPDLLFVGEWREAGEAGQAGEWMDAVARLAQIVRPGGLLVLRSGSGCDALAEELDVDRVPIETGYRGFTIFRKHATETT